MENTSEKEQSKPVCLPVEAFINEGNPNTSQKIEAETGAPVPEVTHVAKKDVDEQLGQDITKAVTNDVPVARFASRIDVTVDMGVVTLRGKVPTENDRVAIIRKAMSFAGSSKVRDFLRVGQ